MAFDFDVTHPAVLEFNNWKQAIGITVYTTLVI